MKIFHLIALTLTFTISSQAFAEPHSQSLPAVEKTDEELLDEGKRLKIEAVESLFMTGSTLGLAVAFNKVGKDTEQDAKLKIKEITAQHKSTADMAGKLNELKKLNKTKIHARIVLRRVLPALSLVGAGMFGYFSYEKFNKAAELEAQVEAKQMPELPLSHSEAHALDFFSGTNAR